MQSAHAYKDKDKDKDKNKGKNAAAAGPPQGGRASPLGGGVTRSAAK